MDSNSSSVIKINERFKRWTNTLRWTLAHCDIGPFACNSEEKKPHKSTHFQSWMSCFTSVRRILFTHMLACSVCSIVYSWIECLVYGPSMFSIRLAVNSNFTPSQRLFGHCYCCCTVRIIVWRWSTIVNWTTLIVAPNGWAEHGYLVTRNSFDSECQINESEHRTTLKTCTHYEFDRFENCCVCTFPLLQ